MRIIFAGSPTFAVPSLRALIESKHRIVGVVTQPARPAGRGRVLADPPVKQFAASAGLKVFQPEKFNSAEFLGTLAGLEPDLIITAAYGRIFRARALGLPRRGCINLHASLLPKYRGVAPVNWAIAGGETVTGVTTFFMDEGVDTGAMILSRATDVGPDETAGELLERLAVIGAEVVLETCNLVESGAAKPVKQDESQASYAPKLTKQDGKIGWSRAAQAVHNHVRGMSPWPGAFCTFRDQPLKVLATGLGAADERPQESGEGGRDAKPGLEPGTVIGIDSAGGILVSCGSGSVRLVTLQAQGKRATASADFARGYRIKAGDRFG